MGIKVQNDAKVFKDKHLSGYDFSRPGNEYTLWLMDKSGEEKRVRISGDMKRIMEQFAEIT